MKIRILVTFGNERWKITHLVDSRERIHLLETLFVYVYSFTSAEIREDGTRCCIRWWMRMAWEKDDNLTVWVILYRERERERKFPRRMGVVDEDAFVQ